MSDINTVNIIGRLAQDPELLNTNSGAQILKLTLAVNSRTKVNGEWADKAGFFDVKAFGERYAKLAQFLQKGKRIGVAGKLEQERWQTNEGQKRSKIVVIAHDMQLLDSVQQPQQSQPVAAIQQPVQQGGFEQVQQQFQATEIPAGVVTTDAPHPDDEIVF